MQVEGTFLSRPEVDCSAACLDMIDGNPPYTQWTLALHSGGRSNCPCPYQLNPEARPRRPHNKTPKAPVSRNELRITVCDALQGPQSGAKKRACSKNEHQAIRTGVQEGPCLPTSLYDEPDLFARRFCGVSEFLAPHLAPGRAEWCREAAPRRGQGEKVRLSQQASEGHLSRALDGAGGWASRAAFGGSGSSGASSGSGGCGGSGGSRPEVRRASVRSFPSWYPAAPGQLCRRERGGTGGEEQGTAVTTVRLEP